ncbi:MAG: ATP synthase F1 subunit epsilon [Patescibacteria group bacterium]
MAMLTLTLVTPERVVESLQARSVLVSTLDGEIAILPGHVPLVSILQPGAVVVELEHGQKHIAVSGGFVDVSEGSRVTLLATTADRAEEIDEAAVERAMQDAKALLSIKGVDEEQLARAATALDRELAKTKALRRWKTSSR